MEFETRKNDYLILKFNRKRSVPITIFLRALCAVDDGLEESPLKNGTDEELLEFFKDIDNGHRSFIYCQHHPPGTRMGSLGWPHHR